MNTYKLLTSAVIFTVAALSIPAVAEAGCTIYEHRDYGGASFTLYDNDRIIMVQGESIGQTTNGHGGGGFTHYYKPWWNDRVSSFRVTSGCTISLWEHINEGGARWRTYKTYKYVGDAWNDEVSEALCTCRG
ncbi:MAG TPA: hypothetical protein VJV05_11960 [Pyrinomonadaceae bacterium]|nr:hypothetical protein [Pyrinomonadaceae bacterium]